MLIEVVAKMANEDMLAHPPVYHLYVDNEIVFTSDNYNDSLELKSKIESIFSLIESVEAEIDSITNADKKKYYDKKRDQMPQIQLPQNRLTRSAHILRHEDGEEYNDNKQYIFKLLSSLRERLPSSLF